MESKTPTKKEITLGLILGLGFGLPALALLLLLVRPWAGRSEALPSPTAGVEIAEGTPGSPPPPPTTSPTPTPLQPTPTATLPPARQEITHVVGAGEVLGQIALEYDVSEEAILERNDLDDPDLIWEGQTLVIPAGEDPRDGTDEELVEEATPAPSPEVSVEAGWEPSILAGNLDLAYPGTHESERFTLHYTPGTYTEGDLERVLGFLNQGLTHIERLLNARIEGPFDVYAAGTPFAPPDQALRGRSFSAARRFFFLHDGTGNAADQQYIATHEMTHLFSWNVFGRPVSAMLSEGVAVYTGMTLIADSDHLPPEHFCAAYHTAGELPRVSSNLRFSGHIRDLDNYYAAGCFVTYLIESYGPEKFGALYPTGDYAGVYGKSLATLEAEWTADLEENGPTLDVAPEALIVATDDLAAAYDRLFAAFERTPEFWDAYLQIDAARIALVEGRLEDVEAHLEALEVTAGP